MTRETHFLSRVPERFQWSLKIDLLGDFYKWMYQQLINKGYKNVTEEEAPYQFFNMRKRELITKPRKVIYSKEFTYPSEYKLALQEFEEKAKAGMDLTPYMSEKIVDCNYNDLLLNDWGIYHFHLSRRYKDNGFVQRNEYQIFAYVDADTIYMLQVYRHDDPVLYSKQEMIKILRDNWPALTESHHLRGVSKLGWKANDEEYGKLRDCYVQTLVELGENEVYGVLGGGYASNGYSSEAFQALAYWERKFTHYQERIIENAGNIGEAINKYHSNFDLFSDMNIWFIGFASEDILTLIEKNSGLIIQMFADQHFFRICRANEIDVLNIRT